MQQKIRSWIRDSRQLKQSLEHWAATVNTRDAQKITALYSPKARVFSTFSGLQQGHESIETYFNQADIHRVELQYQSLCYHPDEKMIEGDYTFTLVGGDRLGASFAFKFNKAGYIMEHASSPKNIHSWRVRNELCICTLLTAATVQSVLKRNKALENTSAALV